MLANVAFALLIWLIIVCAVGVVGSKKLVHSVFWLSGVLLSTAVVFVILDAAFLAGIQVILYTGGVITLMLFGVMLTTRDPGTDIPNPITGRVPAALVAFAVFSVWVHAIWGTEELATASRSSVGLSAESIGGAFLGPHLLAFEALSILLLAAMIGAIVLTRKKDP